jgi:hypothetical protein
VTAVAERRPSAPIGDVIKCQGCGRQSRSISHGCSVCGLGMPTARPLPPLPLFAAPDPVALPGLPAVVVRESALRDGHRYVWLGEDGERLVFLAPRAAAELREVALAVLGMTAAEVHDDWAGTDTWARHLTACEPHQPGRSTCSWCAHHVEAGEWVLDWQDGDRHAGASGWFPVAVFSTEEL